MLAKVLRKILRIVDASPEELPAKSRYEHLIRVFRRENPSRMIEVGVWRGDRSIQFLAGATSLEEYVGFDIFQDMSEERFSAESMGNCLPQDIDAVRDRLESAKSSPTCQIELIPGYTESTLVEFARCSTKKYDFIYIDGGHSLETVKNDWECARKLMSQNGVVVFDDYYMNSDKRGAKQLVDSLVSTGGYKVRFFPIVEDIIENLQITMVEVRLKGD